jgi:hypothetical protein
MSGIRQVFLGFFMALLFSAIVLGSLSLSLVESGYMLGQVPASEFQDVVFSSAKILSIAGDEIEYNAPASRKELNEAELVFQKPTPEPCVHPEGWIMITVLPDHTLKSLAHLTDSSVQRLKDGNCLMIDGLMAGSDLYVPMPPMQPTAARPRPTYQPPVYYWTPYPTVQSWSTPIPWVPTMTPVTPPPTQPATLPPTLPPSPTPTALPPTPFPTAQPPTPFPTAQPTAPNPTPTNPPPTSPPPTSPPPTEPPQPTPVPPTPQPQPTVQPPPQPTEPRLPPPPQPTAPPPIVPTLPPEQQPPVPTIILPGSFPTSWPS